MDRRFWLLLLFIGVLVEAEDISLENSSGGFAALGSLPLFNAPYAPPAAACKQPKAPGLCGGKMLRYAFNEQTGNCISFYYTGCGSTENNFLTFEECRRDCMQKVIY